MSSIELPSAVHKLEMPIFVEEIIAICKFTKSFVLEEGDVELTMDSN